MPTLADLITPYNKLSQEEQLTLISNIQRKRAHNGNANKLAANLASELEELEDTDTDEEEEEA